MFDQADRKLSLFFQAAKDRNGHCLQHNKHVVIGWEWEEMGTAPWERYGSGNVKSRSTSRSSLPLIKGEGKCS